MLIRYFKSKDTTHQNIEPLVIDENGKKVWNIPNDLEELRKAAIDTLNWLIGQNVKNATGDIIKLSASNSKAIALLTKVVASLNPDLSNLTQLEKSAWGKTKILADNGYADSELLNNSLDAVLGNIQKGTELINKALQAQTIEELIKILEQL